MAKDHLGNLVDQGLEMKSEELSVALATRNELATERRSKHSAIIDILKAVVVASTSLFIAMRFNLPETVVAMLPFVGIAIAVVSMLIVRLFRKDLQRIEWKGSDIEQSFKNAGIRTSADLFVRPDTVELKVFTVPVMVHIVLVLFWIGMFFVG